MSRQLVYSIATGRSGTVFLTKLLQANISDTEASIFHERTGFPHFGVNTPDASHCTTFNTIGNAPNVAQFCRQKLDRDLQTPQPSHIEISHFLCKAGLVDNLNYVAGRGQVDLIAIKRDPFKIAWSFVNRFDFFNTGFTWLFSLDNRYPNVIVPADPFREFGMFGSAVWYVNEMFARMKYYRMLVEPLKHVKYHATQLETIIKPEGAANLLTELGFPKNPETVIIPGKENATAQEFFGDKERKVVEHIFENHWKEPIKAGADFFNSGKRLHDPTGSLRRTNRVAS